MRYHTKESIKTNLIVSVVGVGILAGVIGLTRNMFSYKIDSPGVTGHSRPEGIITKQVRFIEHDSGVEVFTRGNRFHQSEYIDTDGDRKADIIFETKPPNFWNRNLETLLVRSTDHLSHRREFDRADSILSYERQR